MTDTTQNTAQATVNSKQTLGFQTEVEQLLQLMIHSLYSNREIFLRELISNASDACDKLRFEALDKPELFEGESDLEIQLDYDKAARTITIQDNGIGLSRQEGIDHLGTIARSGTKEFFGKLTGDKARDSNLIGQFGVGFYSAFIVASKVVVESRRAGLPSTQGMRWTSDGSGEFSIEDCDKPSRGTHITLHLRASDGAEQGEGAESFDDLLSQWKLREIVRKYSDHISLPIKMFKENWDKDSSGHIKTDELETVNQASALWTRAKSDVTAEQYHDFYKALSHDFEAPVAYTHNRVEGRSEYTQLLYLPGKAPFDLYDRQHKRGVRLYVKRVFIMDDAEQLMPGYLRFIKGVIDSSDLPLNVSREILQESRDVKAIREGSTKRVLAMLEDLAENKADQYAGVWTEFGQVLKEGLGEDHNNQERLAKLLRFASTNNDTDTQNVSLAQYIARMKEGQDRIFYVTAESYNSAKNSPHLEVFRKKGVEVLLLSDRVDEWMLSHLNEFEGKTLASVSRGGVDLGALEDEAEKKENEQSAQENQGLVEKVKVALGDKVKAVRVTNRLTDSPACLVSEGGDISGNLERLLKQAGQAAPERKPVLELNPKHPLVQRLKYEDAKLADWSALLFDQATLAEGGQLDDPAAFVKRLNEMLLTLASSK
jgi:molecular chaperone HtpG